jgi:hypothetical protein
MLENDIEKCPPIFEVAKAKKCKTEYDQSKANYDQSQKEDADVCQEKKGSQG